MSLLSNSLYYVQKPIDEYWSVKMPNYVIEARPFDENELKELKKSKKFSKKHFKVISPKEFDPQYVKRKKWIQCLGPARELKQFEYVRLYSSLVPKCQPPKGMKVLSIGTTVKL